MDKNYFGFVDESGVLDAPNSAQPFFAVGFLKLQDTADIGIKLTQRHYDYFSSQKEKRRELLTSLRAQPHSLNDHELNLLLASTRHAEYKFTNINYNTLERYKALLDTALEYPLYFAALVIDKTDPLYDKTIYKNYWYAYMHYTKLLCREHCKPGERLCVIADYMNKPNASDKFFEHEINEMPNVFNTLRAHSETFTLLQVCDILLGSVVFQWKQAKGLINNSGREVAKNRFVSHLIKKLGLPANEKYPLAKRVNYQDSFYFNVTPLDLKQEKK